MHSVNASGDEHEPRIGSALQAVTAELLECGGRLRSLLYGQVAVATTEPIGRLLTELRQQVQTIAVVGQIKAGKSSFVNALAERPGLLPADANPWTAVVSRLHFGKPNGPRSGALFHFFSEVEWRRLADGGDKLRELTERLIPGFRHDLLRRQFDAMRQRAEMRLGKQFRHLLGKAHEFATVTPEVLERYICAGAPTDTPRPEPAAGRFADITRSADLYFDLEPFGHPVIVIDTPGTNDPFLVRDEITRRSLEHADMCIVVLAAQQAFSTADLALLRILHGLNKDRIIVFVNRIDQLADLVRDTREVVAHVRRMLKHEFPTNPIPVIAGSALWGQAACESDPARFEPFATPAFAAYACAVGAANAEEAAQWDAAAPEGHASLRKALRLSSGVPAAGALLSDLMLKGPSANGVKLAAACLTAVGEMLEATARNELASLSAAGPDARDGPPGPAERAEADADLHRLGSLIAEIERVSAAAKDEFSKIYDESLTRLRAALNDAVTSFAASEARALLAALRQKSAEAVWRTDTRPLRRTLEQEFLALHRAAHDRLLAVQQKAIAQLRALLDEVAPDKPALPEQAARLSVPSRSPSLAPLGETVSLDLDQRWWRLWQRQKRSAEEKAHTLYDLIRTDFDAVADALVNSARWDLSKQVTEAGQRVLSLSLSVAKVVRERRRQFGDASDAAPDEQRVRERQDRAARCRTVLAESKDVLRRLKALAETVEREGRSAQGAGGGIARG